ncbi:MAG: hypothetical protein DRP01_11460 [Archaeoglobales archaeon]|nr:MAG: hypothetical protein DRP01_11460 [Archaeoglobales archaeon]
MEGERSFVKIVPKLSRPVLKIKQRRIRLPLKFLEHFTEDYVEILFDPKRNLIAFRPTNDPFNFKLCSDNSKVKNVIFCGAFLRYYSIPPQEVEVEWDSERGMLIGKVKRCTKQ